MEIVTCYWTNDTARQLFERYEKHLRQVEEMLAVPVELQGPSTLGTAAELDAKGDALFAAIRKEMAELVQNFAMPAATLPTIPAIPAR